MQEKDNDLLNGENSENRKNKNKKEKNIGKKMIFRKRLFLLFLILHIQFQKSKLKVEKTIERKKNSQ